MEASTELWKSLDSAPRDGTWFLLARIKEDAVNLVVIQYDSINSCQGRDFWRDQDGGWITPEDLEFESVAWTLIPESQIWKLSKENVHSVIIRRATQMANGELPMSEDPND